MIYLAGATVLATAQQVTEIVVTGARDTHTVSTVETLVAPADTAGMLKAFPGANVNKNGELTGIVQYRGMYGDRVNIAVNGHRISSSGPNAMDAPLHYSPVALLESLVVQRGIAPVSSGMETIGGSMRADTFTGDFGNSDDFESHARIYAGAQSVNAGNVASGLFSLANDRHLFSATLMAEEADDGHHARGSIMPSGYDRDRYGMRYGFRGVDSEFSADIIVNKTGKSGTPALPMDIDFVDSDLVNVEYRREFLDYALEARFSVGELTHGMSNFHLRAAPGSTMLYRYTGADSDNGDFSVMLEKYVDNGLWRAGIDGHFARHDVRIRNPVAPAFGIDSFNDANRNLAGIYIEREAVVRDDISLQMGARINHVSMSAGNVGANLNPMGLETGMPAMIDALAFGLSSRFNAVGRDRTDTNVDLFGRVSVPVDDDLVLYAGAARKTRSPSYQERFAWLPLEISGGLADGRTYVGNFNLAPEVSRELEAGFDYAGPSLEIYPRIFLKDVSNYIQGVPSADPQVANLAGLMAGMGMGSADPLVYANVDARLYGMDLTTRLTLSKDLVISGTYSVVRAERKDIDDNLYRITPDNLVLALEYSANTFDATLETVFYARQDKISATNRELESPGYSLVNLALNFNPTAAIEAGVGINNVFDRHYVDHLAGYNRAINDSVPLHARLPGLGRNIFGRLIWHY